MIDTRRAALVFGYTKRNKYSVGALLGALERRRLDERVRVVVDYLENLPDLITYDLRIKYELIVVAVTLMSTQLPYYLNVIKYLLDKARKLRALTIIGGPHASGDPYGSIISLGFDIAFIGESEETFTNFLRSLLEGNDPLSMKGLAFWDGGKIILTGKPHPVNLNDYPSYSLKYGFLGPIEISRGCPFACRYCQVSYMFGALPRHREVDNIVKHALTLLGRGLRDIRFISPNSFGFGSSGRTPNLEAISELVEGLQKVRKLGGRVFLGTFPSEVRPEFVTEELVKLIKGKVDNKRVIVGAQSGSDRLLKLIGRSHTASDVLEAVKVLKNHGFSVDVDYIFGLPGEDEEDVKETISHMGKVASMGARVHAHVFLPLPGTPFALKPPGKISDVLRRELYKLLGRGLVYGQWAEQERLALKIDKLRKDYTIIATPKRIDYALARFGCRARPIDIALSDVVRA